MTNPLALIALLPLLGFLLNGTFATALGGKKFNHAVAALIACAMPIAAFALTDTGAPRWECTRCSAA